MTRRNPSKPVIFRAPDSYVPRHLPSFIAGPGNTVPGIDDVEALFARADAAGASWSAAVKRWAPGSSWPALAARVYSYASPGGGRTWGLYVEEADSDAEYEETANPYLGRRYNPRKPTVFHAPDSYVPRHLPSYKPGPGREPGVDDVQTLFARADAAGARWSEAVERYAPGSSWPALAERVYFYTSPAAHVWGLYYEEADSDAEYEERGSPPDIGRRYNPTVQPTTGMPITRGDYPALFGDADADTIPDVDDPHPYEPGDTDTIEEVRLSDEIGKLIDERSAFVDAMDTTLKRLKRLAPEGKVMGRVKSPYSMINKLRRKRLKTLTDLAGTSVILPDAAAVERVQQAIEEGAVGDVLEKEDFYAKPLDGYRAYHFIIRVDGKPVEVQVKSQRMKHISQAAHTAYKEGRLNGEVMGYLTDLAARADAGEASAAQELGPWMALSEAALGRKLTRDETRQNPAVSAYALPGIDDIISGFQRITKVWQSEYDAEHALRQLLDRHNLHVTVIGSGIPGRPHERWYLSTERGDSIRQPLNLFYRPGPRPGWVAFQVSF